MQFCPVVYEHAAFFIDKTPQEVSLSGELLFQAHAAAYGHYHHQPIVPAIDLYNIEAEAFGATVETAVAAGVPTIAHRLCTSAEDILHFEPLNPNRSGRLPMVLRAGMRLRRAFPNAEVRLPLSGPFAIASQLVGLERLLMESMDNPDNVARALAFLAGGQIRVARQAARLGLKPMLFESSVAPPLLSPGQFRTLVLPVLSHLLGEIGRVAGKGVPCIIGGDTAKIARELSTCGASYLICPAETDQRAFLHTMRDVPGLMVRVNMDAGVFAGGDPEACLVEAERVCELAADRKRVCIGTGVLPFNADPERVLRVANHIGQTTPALLA